MRLKRRKQRLLKRVEANNKPEDCSSVTGNETAAHCNTPKSPANGHVEKDNRLPLEKDVLVTSMIRFFKSKQRFLKMKAFYEKNCDPLLLAPDSHLRSSP